MSVESVAWRMFNKLRGKYAVDEISLNIKIMCFLNMISGYKLNFDNIDYSTQEGFNNEIYRNVELIQNDSNLVDILLIIVKMGAFRFDPILNEINEDIKKLTNEERIQLFNYSKNSKSDILRSGNFSTNKKLANAVLELVDLDQCESVLDITSGEGTFLEECFKRNHSLRLNGYEFNAVAYIVSRMRLALISNKACIHEYNVLCEEFENEYDFVFSDSPWRMRVNNAPAKDKNMVVNYQTNKKNADWYFIFKSINAMKETGKAIAIVPQGVLFSALDKASRKEIIDKKMLEKIILMPMGSYPGTVASYVIMVFSYNNDQVELIDASDCYERDRNKEVDNGRFSELVHSKNSDKIISVGTDTIKKNDYNLELKLYFNKINDIKLINPKRIGDVAEVISGFQYLSRNVPELEPNEGNVSVLKITNIDDGYIDYDQLCSLDIDEQKINKYLLQENDIVMTARGTAFKFAVIGDLEGRKVVPHNNLIVIRVTSKEVNALYLCNFLMSRTGQLLLESLQSGQALMTIRKPSLEKMEIPVVDLDTQETIANRYLILKDSINEEKKKLQSLMLKMNSIYDDEVGE